MIFLQTLLQRAFRIVPILCGSLDEWLLQGKDPKEEPTLTQWIGYLRKRFSEGSPLCLIASVDLSHMGGRFGDPFPLHGVVLEEIREEDLGMLQMIERGDTEAFLEHIRRTRNRRRVDGVLPIYTLLEVLPSTVGRLLRYEQSVERETHSVVTFASMAFYRN